ncbi:MAG: C4-type zinc ribbon domain-containing protein [Spirochaetaceae bacterium]|jgi:predicted  nucleic acid-binding Zn-ribbon protein|nr:C4-type zinc ribbon domain-containing protein [Spirochaetaceae bacterium]
MAMESIFEKLRTLQEILSEKIKLEHEVEEIPKILVTQEELLARLKKTFIDKNLEYEKCRVAEAEYRSLLEEAESMREKSEKNMDVVSTQREYEALDKEIRDAADREQQHRKDLQREERVIADLDEQIKQNQALIEQQEKELEERRRGIETEVSEKLAQIGRLEEEERKLNEGLDPEVLFKFERIIRNKMGRGIVAIKGGVCMGCHMVLPVQFANTVHQGEDILFCPYCSRILYYEDTDQEGNYFNNEDAGSLSDLDDIDEDEYDEEAEDEESSAAGMEYEE